MTRLALALLLLSVASNASAQPTPTPTPAPAPSPSSLVFVYDGGGARVSGERVRRALVAGLHRTVLRLTDDGAAAASGRLTIAFSPPDRWVIDFARADVHTTRTIVLRSSTVASLTRVALAIVADAEPAAPPPRTASGPRRGEWIALIGDEILDPFGGQPVATRRRSLAMLQELVDPFGGPAAAHRGYDDVIDPWSH
jgi:hypothetical protein